MDDIIKELKDRGYDCKPDVAEEAVQLCTKFKKNVDDFADEIDSFMLKESSDNNNLTSEILIKIDTHLLRKLPQSQRSKLTFAKPIGASPVHMGKANVQKLSSYPGNPSTSNYTPTKPSSNNFATPISNKKRPYVAYTSTPQSAKLSKVIPRTPYSTNASGKLTGTGAEEDPMVLISPEQKVDGYKNHTNAGQIISSFNMDMEVSSEPFGEQNAALENEGMLPPTVQVKSFLPDDIVNASGGDEAYVIDRNLPGVVRYMFSRLHDRAEALEERLNELEDVIRESHADMLDDLSPDQTIVVGRVCSDGEGKLNTSSVLLEQSRTNENASRILLNLNKISTLSLFPGQIVAAIGLQPSPRQLHVEKLITSAPLPIARLPVQQLKQAISPIDTFSNRGSGPMRIWTICGPYTLYGDLSYKPLEDIFHAMEDAKTTQSHPDVLILMGPFVPSDHPSLARGDGQLQDKKGFSVEASFESVWTLRVINKLKLILKVLPRLHIVLMPSADDMMSHPIIPTPPFQADMLKALPSSRVTCVANPSTFVIGEEGNRIVIGGCTADVLFDLNKESIFKKGDSKTERLPRMIQHCVEQRCYYPLYPSNVESPVDISMLKNLQMSVTPDILLLPSRLQPFATKIDDTLAINMGKLTKFNRAGTYAVLEINPIKNEHIQEEIGPDDISVSKQQIPKRTRVTIKTI